jgi:hypothetical protein
MTKVIFRKFKGGEIIALFPAIVGDNNPYATCESYMHIGQHGSASVDLILSTKPAKPEEYAPLLNELKSIGYDDLVVKQRFNRSDLKARINALTY